MSYPQGPSGPQQPPQQPWPPQPYLAQPPHQPPHQTPGAQWQPQMRAHPHPEPRSYPLILRTWDYRWWKPVVGILLGALAFLVLQTALTVILVIGAVVEGGSAPLSDRVTEAASLDTVTPWSMLYVNLGLASLVLVAWLVMRVVHRLRPRWLSSVLPGMRWKFFFVCLGLSAVALLVALIVGALLPHDPNTMEGSARMPSGQLLVTAIVILLTTPLQAMGEEYAFRGYLMQAFGSLTRSRVAALLGTSGLFALAHGAQNAPLFIDRFAFGLMAGLVVILVGGLEAGIALHVFNNLLAFGIAIAYDKLDSTLTVSETSWWQLPVTVAQNGVFLLLVLLVARRMGLRNTTTPPTSEAELQAAGASAR